MGHDNDGDVVPIPRRNISMMPECSASERPVRRTDFVCSENLEGELGWLYSLKLIG